MLGMFLFVLCQTGCSRRTAALSPEKLFQKISPSVFVVESLGQNGITLVLGSAVAVGNDFLITNCHVVQDSWFLRVRRAKETWSATLVYAEPDHDLCGLSVGSGKAQLWDLVTEFRRKWPKEAQVQDPRAVPPTFVPEAPMQNRALPPGATSPGRPWRPNGIDSDEDILQNLQDPAKFRSAFPNYNGLTDEQIRKDIANHIKPGGPSLSPVDIVSSSELATGERVYAVGAPEGLELTFSEGVVSALRDTEGVHMIQTSAAISPGSSGGGLFDAAGNLVGITTFYLKEGQSLNFALPGEWVTKILMESTLPAGANHRPASDSALESAAWIKIGLEAEKGRITSVPRLHF
jgi:S1-C subfamily serine protease